MLIIFNYVCLNQIKIQSNLYYGHRPVYIKQQFKAFKVPIQTIEEKPSRSF